MKRTPIRVPAQYARDKGLMGPDLVIVHAMAAPSPPFEVLLFVCHERYAHLRVNRATHSPIGTSLQTVIAWKRAAEWHAERQRVAA